MLRGFWDELNTPTDYYDDPYGGLTNQISHVALGAFLFGFLCVMFAAITGEMPHKATASVVVIALYGGVIEVWVQRSGLVDALQDTFFFGAGVTVIASSFTEFSVGPRGDILLRLEVQSAFAVLGMIVLSLALYIIPRAARKYRE